LYIQTSCKGARAARRVAAADRARFSNFGIAQRAQASTGAASEQPFAVNRALRLALEHVPAPILVDRFREVAVRSPSSFVFRREEKCRTNEGIGL
jgi:hypothetical protein